jgi:prepilin-type N-terminal cleavage/methylation domain-containing protein
MSDSQLRDSRPDSQKGFTIVELMIATTVLSIILLLVTFMIIGIGRLYTKGINLSRIQDNTRAIVDDVSQHVQLSTQGQFYGPITISTSPYYVGEYCIGDARYTFVINKRLGSGATDVPHVLWRDANPDFFANACPQAAETSKIADMTATVPYPGGTELVAARSRLTAFSIAEEVNSGTVSTPGLYDIHVGLAYGDDDQLCDSSATPDPCPSPTSTLDIISPLDTVVCKGQAGDEFCGTSDLSVSIAQRLTGTN